VKAEYLYMDLGAAPGATINNSTILPGVPQGGFTTVLDTTVNVGGRVRDNIFRLGLNYRFAPEAVVARY
jgi:hypothetical protein